MLKMLRINLLPPYIYEGQKKKVYLFGAIGIAAAALAALVLWNGAVLSKLKEAENQKETSASLLATWTELDGKITSEHALVAKTKAKMTFVDNSKLYNDSWPGAYEQARDVTDRTVLLHSMNIGPDRRTLSLAGFCQYEPDLVRWWMFLRGTQLYNSVHISLPAHPFSPNEPLAVGGGGTPGGAGFGGGGFGGAGGARGPGGPPAGSFGGGGGFGGGGKFANLGGGGGGGNVAAATDDEIEGRKGINFNAVAVLKTALLGGATPPVWPSDGSAASGGGGVGGFPKNFNGGGGPPSSAGSGSFNPSSGGKAGVGTKD